MKTVSINEVVFKKIIEGTKRCIAQGDDYDKAMQLIKVVVKTESITAYACDGYRAARVEVRNAHPIDKEFEFFIKPIGFKVSKRGINVVDIELVRQKAFVEIPTEYGTVKYGFTQPLKGYSFDIEKFYEEARKSDYNVGLTPRYVEDALKAIGGDCMVFKAKENNMKPIILVREEDNVLNEQLILPRHLEV